jgi:hypothetical protein
LTAHYRDAEPLAQCRGNTVLDLVVRSVGLPNLLRGPRSIGRLGGIATQAELPFARIAQVLGDAVMVPVEPDRSPAG